VSDLDINGELDAATISAIRAALNEHKVLVLDAFTSMTRARSGSPVTSGR
jgi:alpha-ketoglutarate-dependent taurine dioxygenase